MKANNLLLTNLWGDGLPLWPATRERVDWILQGTALPRTHVLGKFPPRGGVTTIETCAIALAMAGGRPEYLPVLVAAVEALLDPDVRTSISCRRLRARRFPVVIVNGPIAKQIRLNSGFGCLGPDPQRPAGASIGRALRLMQQNVGGARAGRRHDGDLGRDALHERRVRRGRGRPARGLAAARHRAPRLRAAARTRSRSFSRPASPTSGGAARRRKRPRKTCCRACGAWRTTCARPTSAASWATRKARPAS